MGDVTLSGSQPPPSTELGGLVSTLRKKLPNTEVRVDSESVVLMPSPELAKLGLGGAPLVFQLKPEVDESTEKFNPLLKNGQGQDIMTLMLELIKYLNEQRSNLQISLGQAKMQLVKSEYLSTMSQADKQMASAITNGVVGVGLGLSSAVVQFKGLRQMHAMSGEIDQISQSKVAVMQGRDPSLPQTPRGTESTPGSLGRLRESVGLTGGSGTMPDQEMEMQSMSSMRRTPGSESGTGTSRTPGGDSGRETPESTPMPKEKREQLLQELGDQRDAKQREFFGVEQRQRAVGAVLDSANKASDAFGGMLQADATRAGAEGKNAAAGQAMVDTAMQVILQQTSEAHQSLQQATLTYLQTISQIASAARTV